MARYVAKPATIAAGQSLSAAIDCSTGAPVFLHMPPDWTSARLSFQVSPDNTDYDDLFDASAREITVNVLPGTAMRLDSELWAPVTWLKIRSGGRDQPIPQAVNRTISVVIDTAIA